MVETTHASETTSNRLGAPLFTMSPRWRRLAFLVHVICSVGWLGAVVAYLALAIAGLTGFDATLERAAYPALEWIGWAYESVKSQEQAKAA